MRLLYVAGPFRGVSQWDQEQNTRRAEEVSLELWRMGAAVVCPHCNTRFFQGAAPDEVWLQGDLEILDRCDAVVLVPNWERSTGTKAEVAHADLHNIPVFQWDRDKALIQGFINAAR
jgi:hypothetical protein